MGNHRGGSRMNACTQSQKNMVTRFISLEGWVRHSRTLTCALITERILFSFLIMPSLGMPQPSRDELTPQRHAASLGGEITEEGRSVSSSLRRTGTALWSALLRSRFTCPSLSGGLHASPAQLCRVLVGHAHPGRAAVQRTGHLGRHGHLSQAGDAQLPLGEHQVSPCVCRSLLVARVCT